MTNYKFNIEWEARCRGSIMRVIEAIDEEEAREILIDSLEINLNNNLRSDLEWGVSSVETIE